MRGVALLTAFLLAAWLGAGWAAYGAGPASGSAATGSALDTQDVGLSREEAPLDAEGAAQLFREANALYAEGAYDDAAVRYERVLGGGIENADVRYNLGNAYFKAGMIGRAVLNYERALKLDPGLEDARANLEFVNGLLADRQAPVGGPMSAVLDRMYSAATTPRLSAWASVFYFILFGALILGILRGGLAGWVSRVAVVAGILLIVSGTLLGVRIERARSIHEAVVLAPEVAVRTGPGEDFVLEFRLHEGTKVRAREDRGDWVRVSVAGTDLEGWLPADTVDEI